MDQFEDLSRRNKKITKIVLGFPLLICVLAVAAIMLCLPFFINVGKVRELEKQILSDQDITKEELSYYIDGMEKDKRVNDFLADDFGYNNILLNLYLQKEDYDQVIERASVAIKKDDMPLYHYYLGMAYAGKGDFDNMEKNLIVVTDATPESIMNGFDEESDPNLTAYVASIKENSNSLMELGRFKDLMEKMASDSDEDMTREKAITYLTEMEKSPAIMKFWLDNKDFNTLYLELCLRVEDYNKILVRAPEAIKSKDTPLYHYYLGAAYDKAGMKDLSIEEMKTFLQGNIDTASNDNWARKVELARISVANDYYAKGDYAKSKELAEKVLRERITLATGPKAETLAEFRSTILDKKDYALKSVDSDLDGLSDNLEDLIGTDKNNKDSDSDGYEDKKELIFGHNPYKKSPDDKVTDYELCNTYSRVFTYYPSVYNQ